MIVRWEKWAKIVIKVGVDLYYLLKILIQCVTNIFAEIKSLSDVSMSGRRSYLALKLPGSANYASSTIDNEVTFQRYVINNTSNNNEAIQFMSNISRQNPALLVSAPIGAQHHRVQFFSVEFQIRPLSERGLLMYFGALDDNLDRSLGFVSLSLQGGVVEFRISGPNNRIQIVRSVRMLAIGEWHKIKVTQSGRRLTLWVEGSAAAAMAASGEVLINKDALVYFGGLPDLSRLPFNAISGFPVPFRGCIRQLIVSGSRIVLNETNILCKYKTTML